MSKAIKIQKKKTNTAPMVSVIMPVHNAEAYLDQAILSILGQSYRSFELLIVDDASTDSSWEIISKYTKQNPSRIRAFRIKKCVNAAGNGATNYGLQYAKGDYIARMDADDIAHPNRLEKQIAFMVQNPETILSGTQAYVIDGEGKIIGEKNEPVSHSSIYESYGVIHPIIHPSVMIRRSLLPDPKKIYEMKWDINDDYYTFFRLLQSGKFANLPEKLLYYRIHGKNLSLVNPKKKFFNSVHIRLEAIKQFHYTMSFRSWLLFACQIVFITLIPEQAIVPTYLLLRGMKHKLVSFHRSAFVKLNRMRIEPVPVQS